jgi:hypothetical protein
MSAISDENQALHLAQNMPNFSGEDRASERAPFYEWLTAFCRAMGTPLSKLPSIAGVEICLYTLYYEVFRAGGIEKVVSERLWGHIVRKLQVPIQCANAPYLIRGMYERWLWAVECVKVRGQAPSEIQAVSFSVPRGRPPSDGVKRLTLVPRENHGQDAKEAKMQRKRERALESLNSIHDAEAARARMLDPYSHMTRDRESSRDAYSNFVVPGGVPAPSAFPSFYNSGERRDGFYLLPQVPPSQFGTTDGGGGGSSRGGYRMASSDMRELKAHIMQLPNDMCSRAMRKSSRPHHWEVAVKRLRLSMASGTDIDIHWALACLTLMSFDSAAEFQVTEVPAVSDSVCVLLRSALNFLVSAKANSTQPLHATDIAPLPLFASNSASQKAAVTATAVCDVCSVILHNLSLLPANHGPLSSLQSTIALLSACASAQICPAVALRSANVLTALTRAGALHNVDPLRWAWGIEGLVAFSVGRVVAGHEDPDVLEFSFQSPDSFVTCVGLTSGAHTDPADVAASSLNLIIVAATSSTRDLNALFAAAF